jgi:hypothetical protein
LQENKTAVQAMPGYRATCSLNFYRTIVISSNDIFIPFPSFICFLLSFNLFAITGLDKIRSVSSVAIADVKTSLIFLSTCSLLISVIKRINSIFSACIFITAKIRFFSFQ